MRRDGGWSRLRKSQDERQARGVKVKWKNTWLVSQVIVILALTLILTSFMTLKTIHLTPGSKLVHHENDKGDFVPSIYLIKPTGILNGIVNIFSFKNKRGTRT